MNSSRSGALRICAAGLMMMICNGLVTGGLSVYLPALKEALGISNTASSLLITVRCVSSILAMVLVHHYYKIFSLRTGAALSMFVMGLSFALFCVTRSYAGAVLSLCLFGLTYGLGTVVPTSILIYHGIRENQGAALGLCMAGSGLAYALCTPIISAALERASVFTVLAGEGLLVMAMSGVLFLLIRDASPEKGAVSVKKEKAETAPAGSAPLGLLILTVFFLGAAGQNAPTYLTIHMVNSGCSAATAALAVSGFGLALIGGKCLYGILTDKLGTPWSNRIFFLSLIAGMILFAANRGSAGTAVAAALLMGFGFPPSSVGLSVFASDLYDEEHRERVMERFQLIYVTGGFVTSLLPGFIADHAGSYSPVYLGYAATLLAGLVIVQRRYRARQASAAVSEKECLQHG